MRFAATTLATAIMATGCLGPFSTPCADGLVCGAGQACIPELAQCVDSQRVESCAGLSEGAICILEQGQGACRSGVCTTGCGDGVIIAPEACEGTDYGGATCQSLEFYGGELGCTDTCQLDTSACAGSCGDGVANGPEECDGSGFRQCADIGATYGRTACTDRCIQDRRQCGVVDPTHESADVFVPLNRIWGTSEDNVYAIGEGAVSRYHDGGWRRIPPPTGASLRGLHGRSETEVFVVGTEGAVFMHDGTTWSEVPPPANEELTCVWATPTALFVGSAEGMLHRLDSTGWTSFDLGAPVVELWGDGEQMIAGAQHTPFEFSLFHINGASVVALSTERVGVVADIWGRTINDFYVGSSSGFGVHVVDLVPTPWLPLGIGGVVGRLHGTDDGRLFMVHGQVISALDGSTPVGRFPTVQRVNDVWAGPTTMLAATVAGVYRYGGSHWNPDIRQTGALATGRASTFGQDHYFLGLDRVDHVRNNTLFHSHAVNGIFGAVVGVGTDEWYLGGGSPPTIVHQVGDVPTDEGAIIAGDNYAIQAMALSAEQTVYAAGGTDTRFILRKVDDVWSKWVITDSDQTFYALAASTDDNIWVGAQSTVLHYDGSGWTVHDVGSIVLSIFDIDGVTFVSAGSTIQRFVDGEFLDSMAVDEALGGGNARALWGTHPTDVFTVGGGLAHFDGIAWTRFATADTVMAITGTRDAIHMATANQKIRTLVRRTAWTCASDELDCSDKVDNDCDGYRDAADSDCM